MFDIDPIGAEVHPVPKRAKSGTSSPVPEDHIPASPVARRLRAPSWFDLRLIVGVILLLGSVLVGARIVASADRTTAVWAVTSDLSAGTVLTASDLQKVQVRLVDNGAAYIATTTSPVGRMLTRSVSAQELLPAAAVAPSSAYLTVALAVPAQRVPASLRRGQRVNIYAASTDPDAANSTSLVAPAVTVLEVSGRSTGALSVGSANLQVLISVPECQVETLLEATEGRTISLAVLPSASPKVASADCATVSSPTTGSGPSPTSSTPSPPTPAAPTS